MIEETLIDLGSVSYPLFVGPGLIRKISSDYSLYGGKGRAYVIIDEYIYSNFCSQIQEMEDRLGAVVYKVKAGKGNKTFATAMRIFADLDKQNVSRDSTILAIGGGVIGDLAGFIASCWYRGVNLIHVPTTLLSAVDSCLGGKTAINFKRTVNAVGTYHHPVSILIDTQLLAGLPEREIASGFGEIVKYSVLGASEITNILERGRDVSLDRLGSLISLSLKEKERFVKGDVRESANRLFLNFGHTIGHAIEFSTVFNGSEMLRHGEGVALGMIAIFRICISRGLLQESDMERLKGMLSEHGLPIYFEASSVDMSAERLSEKVVDLAFKDKKRTSNKLRLVVVNGWGRPELYPTDNPELIALGVKEVVV